MVSDLYRALRSVCSECGGSITHGLVSELMLTATPVQRRRLAEGMEWFGDDAGADPHGWVCRDGSCGEVGLFGDLEVSWG